MYDLNQLLHDEGRCGFDCLYCQAERECPPWQTVEEWIKENR